MPLVEHDVFVAPLGNLLLELRLAPFEEHGPDLRLQLYDWCFTRGQNKPGLQSIVLRQLREDARHLEQQRILDLLVYKLKPNDESEVRVVLDVLEVLDRPLGGSAEVLFEDLRSVLAAAHADPKVRVRLEDLAYTLLR
jgi:hypothetical protein